VRGSVVESVDSIVAQGFLARSTNLSATVDVSALTPASAYDVYCVATSLNSGAHFSLAQVLSSGNVTVNTLCCKEAVVSLDAAVLQEGGYQLAALTVTLSHAPSSSISLSYGSSSSALANPAAGGQVVSFFPAAMNVFGTTVERHFVSDAVAGAPGNMTVAVVLAGTSRFEFSLSFTGLSFLEVRAVAAVPPPPRLLSIAFAVNGGSISIQFESETDRGGQATAFPCDALLVLEGGDVSQSACQWANRKHLVVYPSADVGIGSALGLRNGTIRARCTAAAAATAPCAEWPAVTPNVSLATVLAPSTPVLPRVAVSYSASLGSCDDLVLDLGGSTGAGGRAWATPTFSVQVEPAATNTSSLVSFLANQYELSPPSAVPAALLAPGVNYEIGMTLCNFLGACGSTSAFVSIADPTAGALPVISVLGSAERSMLVRDTLDVLARAHTASVACDGSVSTANLQYSWDVYELGQYHETTLVSTSVDPRRFKLSVYTLQPGTWYHVRVKVKNTQTQAESVGGITVTVGRGAMVAIVAGGAAQSIRLGELLLLDGSDSFDEDVPGVFGAEMYTATFTWSCVQLLPSYAPSCPLGLTKTADESFAQVNASDAQTGVAVGVQVRITLTVADSSKAGSFSVELTVVDAASPSITLRSLVPAGGTFRPINTGSNLRLTGVISSAAACDAVWNVSGASLELAVAAITPTTVRTPVLATAYPVFLVLGADSLALRADYRFTLSCRGVAAGLDVTTNGPPQYGSFAVSPATGLPLQTRFLPRASQWFDEHTPISYQFEYATSQGLIMVLQGRSERAHASAMLPAGTTATDFNVTCRVRVFDSLGASAVARTAVHVQEGPTTTGSGVNSTSSTDITAALSGQLAAAEGDLDATRQVIGLYGTVLNIVNCSAVPNCTALGRLECSIKSHTCGACIDGYIGDAGPANGVCLSAAELASVLAAPVVTGSGATYTNKTCDNDCFGHGDCRLVSSATLQPVGHCATNDVGCTASCACHSGYGGGSCGSTDADLAASVALRDSLLGNLLTMTTQEEPSTESVDSWVSGLLLLGEKSDEVSPAGGAAMLSVAMATMNAGDSIELSPSTLSAVLTAVDTAAVASAGSGGNASSASAQTRDILSKMSTQVMAGLVAGQAPFVSTLPTIKLSAQVSGLDGNGSASIPLGVPSSPLEQAFQVPMSALAMQPGGASVTLRRARELVEEGVGATSVSTSVTESKALQFGAAGVDFTANPVGLQIQADDVMDATVVITYQNVRPMSYYVINGTDTNVTTTCLRHQPRSVVSLCPGDVEVVHECNGTYAILVSQCPVKQSYPTCVTLASDDGGDNCVVVNYTATTTTCICEVRGAAIPASRRRRLSTGETVQSFQAVTMVLTVANDVVSTFADVPTSEAEALKVLANTVIVLTLFGIAWVGGLAAIMYVVIDHHMLKLKLKLEWDKDNKKAAAAGEKGSDTRTTGGAAALIRRRRKELEELRAYVMLLIPAVYSPHLSLLMQIRIEIVKYHKYFSYFAPMDSGETRRDRIVTGLSILTATNCFFFAIAACYDIDVSTARQACFMSCAGFVCFIIHYVILFVCLWGLCCCSLLAMMAAARR